MPGPRHVYLDRPPLDPVATGALVDAADSVWTELRVVDETSSTNDDVVALARDGAPAGLVLVAESQTAGRGRLARRWVAPARSALTFSVLLRPASVPVDRWGWLPLLAAVATASAVRALATIDAEVKWPNDVLIEEAKLAGILVQRVEPDAAVVGIGLNVITQPSELPLGATSLIQHDASITDRDAVLSAVLRELAMTYRQWIDHRGDPERSGVGHRYRNLCCTLGRTVRVDVPDGHGHTGFAAGIDRHGRLVVDGRPFSAGDVIHVR